MGSTKPVQVVQLPMEGTIEELVLQERERTASFNSPSSKDETVVAVDGAADGYDTDSALVADAEASWEDDVTVKEADGVSPERSNSKTIKTKRRKKSKEVPRDTLHSNRRNHLLKNMKLLKDATLQVTKVQHHQQVSQHTKHTPRSVVGDPTEVQTQQTSRVGADTSKSSSSSSTTTSYSPFASSSSSSSTTPSEVALPVKKRARFAEVGVDVFVYDQEKS